MGFIFVKLCISQQSNELADVWNIDMYLTHVDLVKI